MAPKWDTDATAKLFTNVVQIHNVKLDYKALADAMTKDSTTEFTAQGIRCYVGRLKGWGSNTSDESISPKSSPGEVPKPKKRAAKPATPRKKARATTTTAKAKKRGIDEVDGEGGEVKGWQHSGPSGSVKDEDGKETQKKPAVKKPRASKKKEAATTAAAAPVVKVEHKDDVSVVDTEPVKEEPHAELESKIEPQRCADSVTGLTDAEVPAAVLDTVAG